MTPTTSPHRGPNSTPCSPSGDTKLSEPSPDTLSIREVASGVTIQAVMEGDIVFFSLTCIVVPRAQVTPADHDDDAGRG